MKYLTFALGCNFGVRGQGLEKFLPFPHCLPVPSARNVAASAFGKIVISYNEDLSERDYCLYEVAFFNVAVPVPSRQFAFSVHNCIYLFCSVVLNT